MPKYTEAFFNITHKPVTIMQIRNEYSTIRFMKGGTRDTYFAHTVKLFH